MVVRYYSYGEFIEDVKKLAAQIEGFDTFLAVARGGLTLAHFLAEAKGVRNVQSVSVVSYEGTKKLDEVKISQLPDLKKSKRVLIVEDIVDSGATLDALLPKLKERNEQVDFQTAALFYKRGALVKPDFFVQYADEWIEFFWTKDIS